MTSLGRRLSWALLTLLLLIPVGAIGVIDPTEARYAEIAREMAVSHDFLVPRLDGLPHFDKPPGAYWALAAGIGTLGNNEWGARLALVGAALLVLWLTGRVAALVCADDATRRPLAIWILAATPLFFALFHLASADPFLAVSVAGFHAAYLDPRRRAGPLPFVALGVGFMIKGPVLFVSTLVPVVVAAIWARRADALRPLRSLGGWGLFALIALPWYVYVSCRVPGLFSFFTGHELWERFATTTHHRPGPPYYFLAVLALGALPWTPLVVRGLGRRMRGVRERGDFEGATIAAWMLAPLVFFTFSGSKLPGYVLPVAPALAVSAAWGLGARTRARMAAVAIVAAFAVIPWFFAGKDEAAGSLRPVVRYLKEHRASGDQVFECGSFFAGLPFYLGHIVPLVDVQRDVRFATPSEKAAVLQAVPADGRIWVFGDEALARRRLAEAGLVPHLEFRWRNWVLLSAVPANGRLYGKGT